MSKISFFIAKIRDVRKDNNELWMDLLRLAFEKSPKEAAKILKGITANDEKVSELTKELQKATEEEIGRETGDI